MGKFLGGLAFGSKKKKSPEVASTVPPPVAVTSEGSPEIEAARRNALARAKNRKGFDSSVRAGNDGGSGYSNSTGQRSLLGL